MNAHQITKVAARAIHAALSNPTQDEPQLVANLVWQIANQFRKAVGVHVQGVFVHSRPTVSCATFPSDEPSSVEIGDLLLLRSNKTRSGKKTAHRALLLQAKKAHTIPANPGHPNQRYLYSDWPRFTYAENMGWLTGRKRHVIGIDLYDAAQYLLILDANPTIPPLTWPWYSKPSAFTAHPSHPLLTHYQHFLRVLICFIMGYAGKTYEKPPPRWSAGWSRVIQDLVGVTGRQTSKFITRASAGGHNQRLCFLAGNFDHGVTEPSTLQHFLRPAASQISTDELAAGPPEVPATYEVSEEGPGGISIIEFTITNEE